MITIYFLKKNSKIKNLEWDVSTITAGDYTVEYKFTEDTYQQFLDSHYNVHDKARGISIGESLKNYLKTEFENLLNVKLREANAEKTDQERSKSLQEVKIADIVFAFNNAELIKLLRLRGGHIMYQRYDQMREVEAQISQLKNDKFTDLTRPVSAFITFEEEDAYNVALTNFEPQYTLTGKLLPSTQKFLQ